MSNINPVGLLWFVLAVSGASLAFGPRAGLWVAFGYAAVDLALFYVVEPLLARRAIKQSVAELERIVVAARKAQQDADFAKTPSKLDLN